MTTRKRKPGRPALPKSERGSYVNVSITAAMRAYLATVEPSPSRAARLVIEAAAKGQVTP